MSEEYDKLLDHDYDGIKELDNDLPTWWLWLFYVTIAWSVLYLLFYHVFNIGYLQEDEYMQEVDPNYVRIAESDSKTLGILDSYHSPFYTPEGDVTPRMILMGAGQVAYVEETSETDTISYIAFTDIADINNGKDLFIRNCLQCHGAAGEGGIGPNLTDDYWLHGASFTNIVKSMKYGYPAKGMIAWRAFLKPDEILQTASFVQTLRGTNPPNQKAPQGELVEE